MQEMDTAQAPLMQSFSKGSFWAIKLTLAILLGVGFYFFTLNLVLFSPHSSIALAAQTKPATDWSFYIVTSNRQDAYNLGCNQGLFDASYSPPINSLVVLDFGTQNSAGTGVTTTQGQSMADSDVEGVSYQFSMGYYNCTGVTDSTSILTLGVGTNDSNPAYSDATYTSLGESWGNVVGVVQAGDTNFSSQVKVWGANDLEAWHYSTGQVTRDQGTAWIAGYTSYDSAPYVNYGDAIGCPTSYTNGNGMPCSYGYYQYDYYWYSWGAPPAVAAPEIYTTSPDNSGQWANISLYAKNVKGVAMQFDGPWDENDFHPSQLTASQAWTDFSTALTAAGVNANLPYSLEIHCELNTNPTSCPNA